MVGCVIVFPHFLFGDLLSYLGFCICKIAILWWRSTPSILMEILVLQRLLEIDL